MMGLDVYNDKRIVVPLVCSCLVAIAGVVCSVAMMEAYSADGFVWPIAILILVPAAVLGLMVALVVAEKFDEPGCLKSFYGGLFSICCIWWCCHSGLEVEKFVGQPSGGLLERALVKTNLRTIVFKGKIIKDRQTVASWPGKYESAWESLVGGAKGADVSAAVVFLPNGSKDFGKHDPIPSKYRLRGQCWCIHLYGERKPWGCRWWSLWIANIDRAIALGATLVVFFFSGRTGKGKVQNFETAASEYMRREEILGRKEEFEKSGAFLNATKAGLCKLSQEKGPDGSSSYSREVHRLFMLWLPEHDRAFLEQSEGLGNSQKAEVAWLDKMGYSYVEKEISSYIEKEISELASTSPKAFGRASEC